MSRRKTHEIDLEIEIDVLTNGALVELVNSILEFLLYQRNQIEFVYKTFKGFVNEWKNEENKATSSSSIKAYMIERQKEKAVQTKESISTMRQLIANAFKQHMISKLRFIFGATTFTAKEAYTLHIPYEKISSFHLYDHHQLPQTRVNQLFLSLLSEVDLYDVFSKDLSPTNLFLEMETIVKATDTTDNTISSNSTARLYPKRNAKLPSNCKEIHFHLRQKLPSNFEHSIPLNCCKEIAVFEEEQQMQPEMVLNESICEKNFAENNDFISNWWETDIIVRGFKQKLVKGNSIWTK